MTTKEREFEQLWTDLKPLVIGGKLELAVELSQGASAGDLLWTMSNELYCDFIDAQASGDERLFFELLDDVRSVVTNYRKYVATYSLQQLLGSLYVHKKSRLYEMEPTLRSDVVKDLGGRFWIVVEKAENGEITQIAERFCCYLGCKHHDLDGNRMHRNCNIYLKVLMDESAPQFIVAPEFGVMCTMYYPERWEKAPSNTNYIAPETPLMVNGYYLGKVVGVVGNRYVVESGQELYHLTARELHNAIGRKAEPINSGPTKQMVMDF